MAEAPIVVSETIQHWRGRNYWRCGFYFARKGYGRLHRRVWKDLYGRIPPGFHVHHKDGNRSNNHPSNLALVAGYRHLSNHSKHPTARQRAARRANARIASEVRLAMARELITCAFCGETGDVAADQLGTAKYCSKRCRQRANEQRQRDRREVFKRKCEGCGSRIRTKRPNKRFCGDPKCYYRAAKRSRGGL